MQVKIKNPVVQNISTGKNVTNQTLENLGRNVFPGDPILYSQEKGRQDTRDQWIPKNNFQES